MYTNILIIALINFMYIYFPIWAGELTRQDKVLATKPNNLSLIFEPQLRESTLTNLSVHLSVHMHTYINRYTFINIILKIKSYYY